MSISHAKPGGIVDVRPLASVLATAKTTPLVQTADLELIRLVLPAGKDIPTHKAPGEITVQCLEGRVAFIAQTKTQDLITGQLLYLAADEPHALRGIEDSSLLATMLLPKIRLHAARFDVVQESSGNRFQPVIRPPIIVTERWQG